jgi:hypothetical protein
MDDDKTKLLKEIIDKDKKKRSKIIEEDIIKFIHKIFWFIHFFKSIYIKWLNH